MVVSFEMAWSICRSIWPDVAIPSSLDHAEAGIANLRHVCLWPSPAIRLVIDSQAGTDQMNVSTNPEQATKRTFGRRVTRPVKSC